MIKVLSMLAVLNSCLVFHPDVLKADVMPAGMKSLSSSMQFVGLDTQDFVLALKDGGYMAEIRWDIVEDASQVPGNGKYRDILGVFAVKRELYEQQIMPKKFKNREERSSFLNSFVSRYGIRLNYTPIGHAGVIPMNHPVAGFTDVFEIGLEKGIPKLQRIKVRYVYTNGLIEDIPYLNQEVRPEPRRPMILHWASAAEPSADSWKMELWIPGLALLVIVIILIKKRNKQRA